ncbi:MAG: TIGR00730 family Rossman fold protein [Chloroflexota bacterium]
MTKHICVYCSSSNSVAPVYFEVARQLGVLLAQQGWRLVYGGGDVGLMGALARTLHDNGGYVIGVIPQSLREKEVGYDACDELIVTTTMRERKAIMEDKADAFIVLPGGFGTLEELLEMLTAKQLKFHQKPIVIVNIAQFYDALLAMFEQMFAAKFARLEDQHLYTVTQNASDAITYIENYTPPDIPDKWL